MNHKEALFPPYFHPFVNKKEGEEGKEDKKDNSTSKKAEELFYKSRSIYFWGEVDDKSCEKAVNQLLLLEADQPGEEIKLYINSPGGVVTSGMTLYDTISLIKSPVSTICMGLAASMGSMLLSVGQKGKRYIFPNGRVMIHQPSIGGYFQGVSADLEIQAREIQKTKEKLGALLSQNCNQPLERVMEDLERDHWMDAKEAVDYGIADKILKKL